MQRRTLVLGAALTIGLLPAQAYAATQSAFDQKVFEAAQSANKPILIVVHADWCPTCKKQQPIVDGLASLPEHKDLVILIVDFDKQKDVLKALRVQQQSTLIAMRGSSEKDRSAGVTDPAAIKALFQKTVG